MYRELKDKKTVMENKLNIQTPEKRNCHRKGKFKS